METNIITKIELFDFMRAFFTDATKYKKLTQSAKKPHLFMWRRMMSIQYPVQMHAIAMLDDIRIMDVLHKRFCGSVYPKWMYTSAGGDKQPKDKSVIQKYDRDVLDAFMVTYNVEYKSLQILNEWYPVLLDEELTKIQLDLYPEMAKQKKEKKAK